MRVCIDVQLQEGQVGIAVIGLLVALLGDIFLEGRGGLRVVSVEAAEDGLDVLRPIRRVVEGNHGVDVREDRPLCAPATKSSNLVRPLRQAFLYRDPNPTSIRVWATLNFMFSGAE